MSLTTPPKVNYLNNRDILKQIHLSKNTYCTFLDPKNDHQFDFIVRDLELIKNPRILAKARRNRLTRINKELATEGKGPIHRHSISIQDLVFRVMTWEHIPLAPKKQPKVKAKKKSIEDILGFEDLPAEDPIDELLGDLPIDPILVDPTHVRVNFPPFWHYRLDSDLKPYVVGKSHWIGDLEHGQYSKDHGQMTRRLAEMFMKLCERYATRSNWRGYTYNEEMRGQALLQLSQIGLQFDESKSQNPFAYYTAAITNSFTRILNIEKKNQNIRDDILEINGLNPSWTRQNSGTVSNSAPGPVVSSYPDSYNN